MGACKFEDRVYAVSAKEAYRILCDIAEEECGSDDYNGTISTTGGFEIVKSYDTCKETEQRKKEVAKLVEEAAEKTHTHGKCYCIDLGVAWYERVILKKTRHKMTAKFTMKYFLKGADRDGNIISLEKADTIKELESKVTYYLRIGFTDLRIIRHYDADGCNTPCEYETVVQKSKTRPKEIKGTVEIREIHRYVFAGWAAE